MADTADIRELETWLISPTMSNAVIEHQDGEWVIASSFRILDLLPSLDRPDCVPSRRDSVIYALVLQLQRLLATGESPAPYTAAEAESVRDALLDWARANWKDALRVDQEMGLGVDYDTFVLPCMPPECQRAYQRLLEIARDKERVHVRRQRRRRVLGWAALVAGVILAIGFRAQIVDGFQFAYASSALIAAGVLLLLGFRVSR